MKVIDFFRSKIILFNIQILILSLFLVLSNYQFQIDFDSKFTVSQKRIIQSIGNYVLFDNLNGLFFIYFGWFIVSLIPILLYNDFKKAYSMNLTTFFFPNFFVFAFLNNISKNYFKSIFLHHFLHSLLLGLLIVMVSIGLTLIIKKIAKFITKEHIENLQIIITQTKSKCPNCETEFNSTPIYCYNCNTKLIRIPEENAGVK